MEESGYLITRPGRTHTNVRRRFFASGDAQDNIYRQAVTAAGTGLYGRPGCRAVFDRKRDYLATKIKTKRMSATATRFRPGVLWGDEVTELFNYANEKKLCPAGRQRGRYQLR